MVSLIDRNSLNLSWTPHRNTGGTPITNYLIEYRSGSQYGWTPYNLDRAITQPHHVMHDLLEGTSYEFRVIAENKMGRSEPSHASQPVVIRELYGK